MRKFDQKKQKKSKPKPREFWFIQLYFKKQLLSSLDTLLEGLKKQKKSKLIKSPPGIYYADPFILEDPLRQYHYLFFEEYFYGGKGKKLKRKKKLKERKIGDERYRKGVISLITLDRDLEQVGEKRVVLERPYHLSFPFVFQDRDGEYYMIPETHQNFTIELYKATNFPTEWELERVLIQGIEASDTILYRDEGGVGNGDGHGDEDGVGNGDGHGDEDGNGLYWLFTTTTTEDKRENNLVIYFSERLEGPWILHPVQLKGGKMLRNAGAIFRLDEDEDKNEDEIENGTLIRPSQDCRKVYGGGIVFNKIVEWSTTRYVEEPIGKLKAEKKLGQIGVHTINFNSELIAIDRCKKI